LDRREGAGRGAVSRATHPGAPRGLGLYASAVVAATLFLVFVGALVTTRDAGLAVPDWPLSFGSINPDGWWREELVRLEHSHRLVGATIGVLTTLLAVWVWRVNRGSRLRWLGPAAFVAVSVQGTLGGLRVTEISTTLAIVHGCFGQAFVCLLAAIAVVHTRAWREGSRIADPGRLRGLRVAAVGFFAVAYGQLVIGAVMRHHKAGLAIPDFPLAYGRLIPPLESFAIAIHFAHRVGAVVVLVAAIFLAARALRGFRANRPLVAGVVVLLVLLALQIALGALVIWLRRATIPTCLHVVNGALVLASGIFVALHAFAIRAQGPLLASAEGGPEGRSA